MVMYGELKIIWNEAAVAYPKVLPNLSSREAKEISKTSIRTANSIGQDSNQDPTK
jgi:hypothetical protein